MISQLQYNKAVETFKQLNPDSPVPTLASINKNLTKRHKELLKDNVELVIAPAITKNFALDDMLTNFDGNEPIPHYTWSDLWDKLDHTAPMTVSLVLMDGDNVYAEPGLVHTNKTVSEQRAALKKEKYESISIAEYLVLWKIEGKLDVITWTRLVSYPDTKLAGGAVVVPYVRSGGRQLKLSESNVGYDWGTGGVRRVLRVSGDFELEPLPESSASVIDITYKQQLLEKVRALKWTGMEIKEGSDAWQQEAGFNKALEMFKAIIESEQA